MAVVVPVSPLRDRICGRRRVLIVMPRREVLALLALSVAVYGKMAAYADEYEMKDPQIQGMGGPPGKIPRRRGIGRPWGKIQQQPGKGRPWGKIQQQPGKGGSWGKITQHPAIGGSWGKIQQQPGKGGSWGKIPQQPGKGGPWGKIQQQPGKGGSWGKISQRPENGGRWGNRRRRPWSRGPWGNRRRRPWSRGPWGKRRQHPGMGGAWGKFPKLLGMGGRWRKISLRPGKGVRWGNRPGFPGMRRSWSKLRRPPGMRLPWGKRPLLPGMGEPWGKGFPGPKVATAQIWHPLSVMQVPRGLSRQRRSVGSVSSDWNDYYEGLHKPAYSGQDYLTGDIAEATPPPSWTAKDTTEELKQSTEYPMCKICTLSPMCGPDSFLVAPVALKSAGAGSIYCRACNTCIRLQIVPFCDVPNICHENDIGNRLENCSPSCVKHEIFEDIEEGKRYCKSCPYCDTHCSANSRNTITTAKTTDTTTAKTTDTTAAKTTDTTAAAELNPQQKCPEELCSQMIESDHSDLRENCAPDCQQHRINKFWDNKGDCICVTCNIQCCAEQANPTATTTTATTTAAPYLEPADRCPELDCSHLSYNCEPSCISFRKVKVKSGRECDVCSKCKLICNVVLRGISLLKTLIHPIPSEP